MKEFFAAILGLAFIVLAMYVLNYAGLTSFKIFGPQYEQARREVFEETKSYRDGTRRDFDNLYLQYKSAKSDDEKAAVLSVIRHRAAGAPPDVVPSEISNLLH